jgi:hypothetical protein
MITRVSAFLAALMLAGAALAQKAEVFSDAYGVASGYAVKTEPDAWSVVEGKLYLNYDRSVQASWVKDIPGYIRKADANWPAVALSSKALGR